jgi:hypothetical protein
MKPAPDKPRILPIKSVKIGSRHRRDMGFSDERGNEKLTVGGH